MAGGGVVVAGGGSQWRYMLPVGFSTRRISMRRTAIMVRYDCVSLSRCAGSPASFVRSS